ncbi:MULTISPECIES: hypothetical protein [unclassified Burkholderia]|uniref:hypothetical protein n=1 Tax=unclassified Burkholderia TaxID=2613784 RepID=UPI0021AB37E5|nr:MULTISPECIES: hypothetical protein [unclassified Burkholderia]
MTNGVHVPTWDSAWSDDLWTRACGKGRWLGAVDGHTAAVAACDDETLWALSAQQRRDLVRYARARLAWQLGQRGEPSDKLAYASRVLDPNIPTLGFARRFTGYKRPNLLLRDSARLARLLTNEKLTVQLIVTGKAHPDDVEGKELIHEWFDDTLFRRCARAWYTLRTTIWRSRSSLCKASMCGSTRRGARGRHAVRAG